MHAQKAEEAELNSLFSGSYSFSLNKKSLEVEFLKDGEAYLSDAFLYSVIDWEKVQYDEEDHSVVIPCLAEQRPCIDRKIYKTKTRQPFPKTEWKVGSKDEADKVIGILQILAPE